MNLQNCYDEFGGDFNDALQRLPSEAMIKKFVLKFLEDKSFENLCDALKNSDYPKAFMAAHTLKGICQNLSFTKLYHSSASLTEALRSETLNVELAENLAATVMKDYQITADAIRKFQSEN